ncbi:MAG TPA: VOC family protein [Candidatus Binatia bacterium]|nr:VOC family protein [Candidatus Binatia bacterium]
MGLPNGVHHLAIATADLQAQIEFFTQVVGAELVGLYWMHGVKDTVHAFLRLSDQSMIAFVHGPQIKSVRPAVGISHAGYTAGVVAPGAVQHIALNVATEADLLAMRDRLRSHGYWVLGPIDHGMCKSIYLTAPEGIQLEFASSAGVAVDAQAWIDPDVAAHCQISTADLQRFCQPAPFRSLGGTVPQPAAGLRPGFEFPEELRAMGEAMLQMSDAEIAAALDHPTTPAQDRATMQQAAVA